MTRNVFLISRRFCSTCLRSLDGLEVKFGKLSSLQQVNVQYHVEQIAQTVNGSGNVAIEDLLVDVDNFNETLVNHPTLLFQIQPEYLTSLMRTQVASLVVGTRIPQIVRDLKLTDPQSKLLLQYLAPGIVDVYKESIWKEFVLGVTKLTEDEVNLLITEQLLPDVETSGISPIQIMQRLYHLKYFSALDNWVVHNGFENLPIDESLAFYEHTLRKYCTFWCFQRNVIIKELPIILRKLNSPKLTTFCVRNVIPEIIPEFLLELQCFPAQEIELSEEDLLEVERRVDEDIWRKNLGLLTQHLTCGEMYMRLLQQNVED